LKLLCFGGLEQQLENLRVVTGFKKIATESKSLGLFLNNNANNSEDIFLYKLTKKQRPH